MYAPKLRERKLKKYSIADQDILHLHTTTGGKNRTGKRPTFTGTGE
jgi:hypothetical protein